MPSLRATNRSSDSKWSYIQPFEHDWSFLFTSPHQPQIFSFTFHYHGELPYRLAMQPVTWQCNLFPKQSEWHLPHITHYQVYVRALWWPYDWCTVKTVTVIFSEMSGYHHSSTQPNPKGRSNILNTNYKHLMIRNRKWLDELLNKPASYLSNKISWGMLQNPKMQSLPL